MPLNRWALVLVMAACSSGAPTSAPQPVEKIAGIQLVAGRAIAEPKVVTVDGATWVTSHLRTRAAGVPARGAYDLRMVRAGSGEQRTVVENVSEALNGSSSGGYLLR